MVAEVMAVNDDLQSDLWMEAIRWASESDDEKTAVKCTYSESLLPYTHFGI